MVTMWGYTYVKVIMMIMPLSKHDYLIYFKIYNFICQLYIGKAGGWGKMEENKHHTKE